MNTLPPEDLGQLIEYFRWLKNIPTRKELAKRTNVDVNALYLIEVGKTKKPRVETLELIKEALDLTEAERKLLDDALVRNVKNKKLTQKKSSSKKKGRKIESSIERKLEKVETTSSEPKETASASNAKVNAPTLSPGIATILESNEQKVIQAALDTNLETEKEDTPKPSQAPIFKKKRKLTITAIAVSIFIILILVFASTIYSESFKGNSGKPLYSANWSKGMNGWTGVHGQWSVSSGSLVNSPNANGFQSILILAPYKTTRISNFVVEVTIKILHLDGDFGVYLRGNPNNIGYKVGIQTGTGSHTYLAVSCNASCGELQRNLYPTDFNWHTYQIVIKGNTIKMYVDGNNLPILYAVDLDNTVSSGDILGLYANHIRIAVRSFKVYAL